MNAVVADTANHRAFFDFVDDVLVMGAVGRILDAQLDIFEKLGVPERLKIAAEGFLVIGVTLAGEDACLQSIRADTAISEEIDVVDNRRLLPGLFLLREFGFGVGLV
jgi:hypothetical protein